MKGNFAIESERKPFPKWVETCRDLRARLAARDWSIKMSTITYVEGLQPGSIDFYASRHRGTWDDATFAAGRMLSGWGDRAIVLTTESFARVGVDPASPSCTLDELVDLYRAGAVDVFDALMVFRLGADGELDSWMLPYMGPREGRFAWLDSHAFELNNSRQGPIFDELARLNRFRGNAALLPNLEHTRTMIRRVLQSLAYDCYHRREACPNAS